MKIDNLFGASRTAPFLLYSPKQEKATCGKKTRPHVAQKLVQVFRPFSLMLRYNWRDKSKRPSAQNVHAVRREGLH